MFLKIKPCLNFQVPCLIARIIYCFISEKNLLNNEQFMQNSQGLGRIFLSFCLLTTHILWNVSGYYSIGVVKAYEDKKFLTSPCSKKKEEREKIFMSHEYLFWGHFGTLYHASTSTCIYIKDNEYFFYFRETT